MQLIERHSTAIYAAPAGTIPTVPPNETADRIELNIDGMRYVWKRNSVGMYTRYAGPIGWLTAKEFMPEHLRGDVQEAQANG